MPSSRRSSCLAATLLVAAVLLAPAAALRAQGWSGPASIEVRVEDVKGKDVAGAEVVLEYLNLEGSGGPAIVPTDGSGRVALGGLAAGAWSLEVRKQGYMSYRAEILLSADGKPELVVASQHNVPGAVSTMRVRLGRAKNAPIARPAVVVVEAPVTAPAPPAPAPARALSPETSERDAKTPSREETEITTAPPAVAAWPAAPASAPAAAAPAPAPAAPPTSAARDEKAPLKEGPPEVAPAPSAAAPAVDPAPAPAAMAPVESAPGSVVVKEEQPPSKKETEPAAVIPRAAAPAPAPAQPAPPSPVSAPVANQPAAPAAPATPAAQVAPAQPAPVQPVAAPLARSCFECRPGEAAMAVSSFVATGGERCSTDFASSLRGLSIAELDALGPAGNACALLRIDLPDGARYTGFRYEAEGPNGRAADCMAGKECPVGAARFVSEPVIRREGARTTVVALFEASADRRGTFTAYWTRSKR